MSRVSVLIAVYNAEKYLTECLDSVCGQTLRDIQIICIDDCSTDSSGDILKRYSLADSRIQVISLSKNSGQAVARNEGLRLVDGEYVMMLDSDDWLASDAIEKAYRAVTSAEDIDCGLLHLKLYYEEGQREESYQNRTTKTEFSGEEAFLLSLDWSLHGLYLVRTSIHRAHPYDTSCRLYSDDNTTRMHYLYSRRVVLTEGVYYYRQHMESTTARISILRFDYMDANLSMKRTLLAAIEDGMVSNPEEVINMYETHRWLNIVDAYWLYYTHRRSFTSSEQCEIHHRIAEKLKTVERSRIPLKLRLKLGYYPFRSYRMFCLVENFYFCMRELFRKYNVKKRKE